MACSAVVSASPPRALAAANADMTARVPTFSLLCRSFPSSVPCKARWAVATASASASAWLMCCANDRAASSADDLHAETRAIRNAIKVSCRPASSYETLFQPFVQTTSTLGAYCRLVSHLTVSRA